MISTPIAGAVDELGQKMVCFAPDTRLLTPEGWKAIAEFQPGDKVLSAPDDDPCGPVSVQEVEEVFTNELPLVHLHVGGQLIRTTQLHPFFVQGKGWL